MNVGTVAGPLLVLLGVLILQQRPRHAMGRLYLVVGVLMVVFAFANSGLVEGLPNTLQLALRWFAAWAWAVPAILVSTFGLLLLPDGRLPGPRWRWVARASALGILGFVLGMPYDESVDPRLRAAMPEWGAPVAEAALLAGMALVLVAVPLSLVAPVLRMRRGGPAMRRQLAPVAIAATAALAIWVLENTLVELLPVDHDVTLAVAVSLIPIGVAVAVLRGGLFDIHRLVSRVVAYALIIGVFGASYLGLVVALGAAARGLTRESGDIVVALSTLTVAALFQPLRTRVRRGVERRFDRERYDAGRTVDAFGRSLRDEVSRDAVVDGLRRVATEAFGPSTAGLVLVQGELRPEGAAS